AAAVFTEAGYQHQVDVLMRHSDAAPDRPADPAITVESVAWQDLGEVDRRSWRDDLPNASAEAIEQLVRRRATKLLGADEVRFLAVRDDAGEVVSRAELYLDAARGIGQIEELMTRPGYGGRGYARAILADGLRRALDAGCDLVFLEAEADDWPRQLYAKLGYVTVGQVHVFTRRAPNH
ncbi:MAG TPA: GNAT family N-acetyltransferase, partial [Micromonosporaceae bacterium]